MTRKRDQSHKPGDSHKRKSKPKIPSTGWGANSALDALIRRRVAQPGQGGAPSQYPSKKP